MSTKRKLTNKKPIKQAWFGSSKDYNSAKSLNSDDDKFNDVWTTEAWGSGELNPTFIVDGKSIPSVSWSNKKDMKDVLKFYLDNGIDTSNLKIGDTNLSDISTVSDLLDKLDKAGYHINIDGTAGRQTMNALDAYLGALYRQTGDNNPTLNQVDEKSQIPIETPTYVPPVLYKNNLFSDDDIRNLGFRNFAGMRDTIKANQNNPFAKLMISRYGNDFDKWNQANIENDLGVSGKYRSFGRGDFGDMSRAMYDWAGQQDAITLNKIDARNYLLQALKDNPDIAKQYGITLHKNGGSINNQDAFTAYLADKNPGKNINTLVKTLASKPSDDSSKGATNKLEEEYINFLNELKVAKMGTKIEYLNKLRGGCPEGYETLYFKQGGHVCSKCMKKGKKIQNPTDKKLFFKKGDRIPETQEVYKKGSKINKDCGGVKLACGKKLSKHKVGGILFFQEGGKSNTRKNQEDKGFWGTLADWAPAITAGATGITSLGTAFTTLMYTNPQFRKGVLKLLKNMGVKGFLGVVPATPLEGAQPGVIDYSRMGLGASYAGIPIQESQRR